MSGTPRFEAFVLAGGASTRFGRNKALAEVGGKTLLERALHTARRLGTTPRVVARDPLPYLSRASVFVLSEREGKGPLEGLRAVLRSCAAPHAVVLAVDMPGVSTGVLRALLVRAGEGDAPHAVCLEGEGRRHPFPGVYATAALPVLVDLPVDGSLQAALDALGAISLSVPAEVVRNVNRPDDLRGPKTLF